MITISPQSLQVDIPALKPVEDLVDYIEAFQEGIELLMVNDKILSALRILQFLKAMQPKGQQIHSDELTIADVRL